MIDEKKGTVVITDENGKHYIVYTDYSEDEDGSVNVYAATYDPSGENSKLEPVTTERENKIIEAVITETQKKINEGLEDE